MTTADGGMYTICGYPVILADNQAIIGASSKGEVYIFNRNFAGLDNWGEVQRLTSSDPAVSFGFGSRIADNVPRNHMIRKRSFP